MKIELIEITTNTTESLDYITGEKSTEITKLWKLDIDSEIYERFLNKNGVSWTWTRSITGTPMPSGWLYNGGTGSTTNSASTYYTQQKYSESQLESFFKNMIRVKKLERVV